MSFIIIFTIIKFHFHIDSVPYPDLEIEQERDVMMLWAKSDLNPIAKIPISVMRRSLIYLHCAWPITGWRLRGGGRATQAVRHIFSSRQRRNGVELATAAVLLWWSVVFVFNSGVTAISPVTTTNMWIYRLHSCELRIVHFFMSVLDIRFLKYFFNA